MAVHGYGRASTNKQVLTADAQKDAIRLYCRAHGLLGEVPAEPCWYFDPATSGKTLLREREAGRALCENLRPGDHLVIARLDRAFRSLKDCAWMLDEFRRRGINLHVCNLMGGAIDLSSAIGLFFIHILAAFAELERSFTSERTAEALAARRRRGLAPTGARRLGFKHVIRTRHVNGRVVKERVEVPDPYERDIMKMILGWRQEEPARSYDWIRQHLNYKLRLPNKAGREWTEPALARACLAEARLQLEEAEDREGRDIRIGR